MVRARTALAFASFIVVLAAAAGCGSSSESTAHYVGRASAASTDLAAVLASAASASNADGSAASCRQDRPRIQADLRALDDAPDARLKARVVTFGASLLKFVDDCSAGDVLAVQRDLPALSHDADSVTARIHALSDS